MNPVTEQLLPACDEKFLKIHWIHMQDSHLAYRKRALKPIQLHPQQTPRTQNPVIFIRLTEIFQRSNGPFTDLYLVKKDRNFFRNSFSQQLANLQKQSFRAKIPLKDRSNIPLFLQIQIKIFRIFFFQKFFYDPCFSYLPCAYHHQWFRSLATLPIL